ncbi:hypothetical protein [Fulvimarina manganoxydans]|uniref:hypothetical protein n=1 Tax=Fulvimarina manganoxydans TaxID=937218 RepID=UPI0014827D7F|nr:hypothetical protein [Fulvimarina manganoxydans]
MDPADLFVDPLDARLVGDRFAQIGESATHILDLFRDTGGEIAAEFFAQPDQLVAQFLDGRAFGTNAIVAIASIGRLGSSEGRAWSTILVHRRVACAVRGNGMSRSARGTFDRTVATWVGGLPRLRRRLAIQHLLPHHNFGDGVVEACRPTSARLGRLGVDLRPGCLRTLGKIAKGASRRSLRLAARLSTATFLLACLRHAIQALLQHFQSSGQVRKRGVPFRPAIQVDLIPRQLGHVAFLVSRFGWASLCLALTLAWPVIFKEHGK